MNDQLLWFTARGSGTVSQILLTAVVALGVLYVGRFEAPGWPRFVTAGLHRNLTLVAVVFLTLHVVTSVVDPFTHLGWAIVVIPFATDYRTFWLGLGTIATELLAAIVITSLLRARLGHRPWRAVHWLAYACWPVAVVHGLGTGTDTLAGWMVAINLICVGVVAAAVGARLLMRPADPLAEVRANFRSASRR